MAPITRLQEKPSLRIKYTAGSNAVRNRNSMIKPALAPTGGIVKKSTSSKKQKPKPKPRRDCVICANNRAPQSFKVLENIQTCAHLHDTCKMCVERLIKAKVTDRRLHDAVLACPFPECDVVLEFTAVEKIVSKRTFDFWDQALLKYHLGASDHFIACLNPVCSCHFSVEGWKEECKDKKKIACPYCDSKLCGSCNRLWHGGKDCDKAKDAEDEASEELIKAIGAKPCPSCGVNIEKIGGCDHMACHRCNDNFCWQCLVPYSAHMSHGEGCPYSRQNIAADPGNYWDGPLPGLGLDGILDQQPQAAIPPATPVAPVAQVAPHAPRPPGSGPAAHATNNLD